MGNLEKLLEAVKFTHNLDNIVSFIELADIDVDCIGEVDSFYDDPGEGWDWVEKENDDIAAGLYKREDLPRIRLERALEKFYDSKVCKHCYGSIEFSNENDRHFELKCSCCGRDLTEEILDAIGHKQIEE